MAQLLWTQKQDVGPSARSDVAMVFDAVRGRVLLFGGAGSTPMLFNDTWEWDGENWTQYEDIGPAPRSRHGMAYDSKRQRTVLFGGSAGNANLNDTWEWDGDNWTEVADTGPSTRGGHAMAYDSLRGRVVLFGGDDGQNFLAIPGRGMVRAGLKRRIRVHRCAASMAWITTTCGTASCS